MNEKDRTRLREIEIYLAKEESLMGNFLDRNYPKGDFQQQRDSHGMSGTRIYRIWSGMKIRCMDKTRQNYKYYGGRGVSVCERWMKFINFYNDMGNCPAGMTLDRKDNEKGYYKENCRWATRKEQQNNTRGNRYIEFNGERKTLTQWSKCTGISAPCISYRIKRGLSINDVFAPTKKSLMKAR